MSSAPKWTEQQQKAIDTRDKTLLVSAAAGSGKTAVLTQRAVDRMLEDNNPIAADRLLVVTFTRSAAQEMKQRIAQKLTDYILKNPKDINAKRQRNLLDRAMVGTIDALCINILREYKQAAGLPASFRVGDNTEIEQMQENAVAEVLEQAHIEANPHFLQLSELLLKGRDDQSLSDTVLKILKFSYTHPFPMNWLKEKLAVYQQGSKNPNQSIWAEIIFDYAEKTLKYHKTTLDEVVEEIEEQADFAGYFPAFHSDKLTVDKLFEAVKAKDWENCYMVASNYKAERLGRLTKGADESYKEELKAVRDKTKAMLANMQEKLFITDTIGFLEDVNDLLPKIKILFELVEKTHNILWAQKMERGVFEFADFEQLTVSLLATQTENGFVATEVAKELKASFDEIMVDECQDINAVQDTIITSLSRGDNLFMVGDVKQSIYRFRQAKPEIFLNRTEEYRYLEETADRGLITLSGNFRSREGITNGVNDIFKPLFSKNVGELIYDELHFLLPMASYPQLEKPCCEVVLLEKEKLLSSEATQKEAEFVAAKIKAMIQSKQLVTKNGKLVPIKAGDIAILLRSPKKSASVYQRALELAGISSAASVEDGFLSSPEISAMLNLLFALYNPTLDIELIGALLSPIFNFSATEIATIKGQCKKGRFYSALVSFAEQNTAEQELNHKVKNLLALFEEFRVASLTMSVYQLIVLILDKTKFDLTCLATSCGNQKMANLNLLQEYARGYEANGYNGLSAFYKMLLAIKERGDDLASAFIGEQNNRVSITSIHKSKGLEWPVVFLCGAEKEFSFFRNDLISSTILHSEMGFACVRRNEETRQQFSTVSLGAVRLESARAMLSEEMRVLYVAATRAKERFIVTAPVRDVAQHIIEANHGSHLLDSVQVRECKSYIQWILLALACYEDLQEGLKKGNVNGISFKKHSLVAEEIIEETAVEVEPEPAEEIDYSYLSKRLAFSYPYAKNTVIPAKISVSQLTHSGDKNLFKALPSFKKEEATGAQRGVATHTFMQFCDYSLAFADTEKEVNRLAEKGIITLAQKDLINLDDLKKFFESSLYKRISKGEKVLREFPFMVGAEKITMAQELVGENNCGAMIQGVADCIVFEADGAVVVDYKTDRVKSAKQLIGYYEQQLLLYKEMLSQLLPIKVKECVIWSFALGEEIIIK